MFTLGGTIGRTSLEACSMGWQLSLLIGVETTNHPIILKHLDSVSSLKKLKN